ncbi:ABC transporter ATP-binding protein [Nocardioides hungaricus]
MSRLIALLRPPPDDSGLVEAAPPMTIVGVLRRFGPRLRGLRRWLAFGLLLLAAAPLIEVAEVMLFQRLVDDVLVPADLGPLLTIALLYIGLNLAGALVSGADDYLTTWISQRFLFDLRSDVFGHTLSLPLPSLDRRRLGDVMSRLTSDVAAVESFMIGNLASGIGNLVRLIVYVGALVWLDWLLALAALAVVPLLGWVTSRFARFVRAVSRERRRRSGSLSAVAEENLANAALVQAYGREGDALAKYQRENRAIVGAELAGSRIRAVFLPAVDLAELVGVLAVVGLGTWALSQDRLTVGGLLAFLALLAQCYGPLRSLADLVPALFSASAGVERIVDLLDQERPTDRPGARPLAPTAGAVELRGVSVRYPDAARDALTDVDLRVAPGECVALLGPSGAGKTTVARLLTRHLDPDHGRVAIDGVDLRDATLASVREAVTVVLQEQLLLDETVHDNIAFARPDADRADVVAAARAADADEFVRRLPDGYDTRIGQRGRSLSGGQRQRLAMARALLRDAPVLVLDEPTTGLDPDTARRVMSALVAAAGRRTVLVITHDPAVLDVIDRVVRLDHGRIVGEPVPA